MLKRLAILAIACSAFVAKAQATSYSPRIGLLLMSPGVTNWGIRLNNEVFSVIDSSVAWLTATNDFQSSNTFHAGVLFVNSAITMTGAGGTFVNDSSVTTNGGFFGNCWGCTNINPAALPVTVITGTGTANQLSYFDATEHITSTGAMTIIGTTIRFGNRGTSLPTSDVHVVIGDGARAFNINLSEDPVYLEMAGNGSQAAIGFSNSGNKKYILGKTPHGNFALFDAGAGASPFYIEDGTRKVAVGQTLAGDDIFTDTAFNVYGVMTMRGTGATQAVSSNDNGTIYMDQGNGTRLKRFIVSESAGSYNVMAKVVRLGPPQFERPIMDANQVVYGFSDSVIQSSPTFQFNGSSLTLLGAALFTSTVTALNFSGSGSLLTGVIHTGDAAGGDLTGTFPNPTIPTLGVLGISTAALSARITADGIAIATNSAVIGQLSISTANLAALITANGVAIATNSFVIGQLNVSTVSLAAAIAANAVSIATNSAARIAGDNALAVSTASIQVQVDAINNSTGAFVKKSGDIMTGDLTVNISTIYAQGGSVAISSATNAANSWLIVGRTSSNGSFITNTNAGGSLTFMPGKANPQLIMGNAQTTGSAFIDASSGRPLFIQSLTTGSVTIGGAGATTLVISPNLFSIGTSTFVIVGGHIAVGTTTTTDADLTIVQQTAFAGVRVDHYSSDIVGSAVIGRKAEGTIDAPTAVLSGDRIMTFGGIGADAGASTFPSSSTANMQIIAAENFSSTNHGTLIKFNTTAIGTTTTVTALQVGPGNSITVSSVAFMGVEYSTKASAGAGVSNTVLCSSGKYAEYGGCDCTGTALVTAVVNRPNSVTAGVLPTGHTCQVVGTPGGACAAFVRCSIIQ